MSDEGWINKLQVARLLDCAARQVERYEADADLPLPIAVSAPKGSKRGHRYDPLAVKLWEVEFRRLKAGLSSPSSDMDDVDYNVQRARLTKHQADKAELEVAEIRGQVVRMPLVEQHWIGMVASMRAKLLALPAKAASMVAAPHRLAAVQEQLRELVYEALNEIAGDGIPAESRERAKRAA